MRLRHVLQIMPAQPGYRAGFAQEDGSMEVREVVAWALCEMREAARWELGRGGWGEPDEAIERFREVAAMVLGDRADLMFPDECTNFVRIYGPGEYVDKAKEKAEGR